MLFTSDRAQLATLLLMLAHEDYVQGLVASAAWHHANIMNTWRGILMPMHAPDPAPVPTACAVAHLGGGQRERARVPRGDLAAHQEDDARAGAPSCLHHPHLRAAPLPVLHPVRLLRMQPTVKTCCALSRMVHVVSSRSAKRVACRAACRPPSEVLGACSLSHHCMEVGRFAACITTVPAASLSRLCSSALAGSCSSRTGLLGACWSSSAGRPGWASGMASRESGRDGAF